MIEEGICYTSDVNMPSTESKTSYYPKKLRLPPAWTAPDRVFFCCKVFDYQQKRFLKNPR